MILAKKWNCPMLQASQINEFIAEFPKTGTPLVLAKAYHLQLDEELIHHFLFEQALDHSSLVLNFISEAGQTTLSAQLDTESVESKLLKQFEKMFHNFQLI